jgi:GDP-4-dehydro-6-deoxy-D-mannose reductase
MILVTGATGFVGKAVCSRLARSPTSWIGIGRDAMYRSADGNASMTHFAWRMNAIAELLSGGEPSAIIHLAGPALLSNPDQSNDHFRLLDDVLEACVQAGIAPRIVLASSAAVYGPQSTTRPVSEDDPVAPLGDYAEAKARAESLLNQAVSGIRARGTVCRLFNAVGPGQKAGILIDILDQVLPGRPNKPSTVSVRSASPRRDFVDVRDAAAWLVELATRVEAPPGIVNLCSGKAVSVGELVAMVSRLLGRKLVLSEREPDRTEDLIGDPKLLRGLLPGFDPIPLDQSIMDLVWLRNRHETMRRQEWAR